MRQKNMRSETALAAALEAWAASRERAARELSRRATTLSHQGSEADAAHFNFAARCLTIKAVHERARAAALREAA